MAKLTEQNGNAFRWLALVGVIVIVIGWIWNAAILSRDLKVNIADDEKTHTKLQQTGTDNREAILRLQSDVQYIRTGIDEIKKELKK